MPSALERTTNPQAFVHVTEETGRQRAETLQRVAGRRVGSTPGYAANGFGPLARHTRRRRAPTAHWRAALHDGLVEQPLAGRRQYVMADADTAGAASEDGHEAGVAAEPADVVSDPAQCRHLVLGPVVARYRVVLGAQVTCVDIRYRNFR